MVSFLLMIGVAMRHDGMVLTTIPLVTPLCAVTHFQALRAGKSAIQ